MIGLVPGWQEGQMDGNPDGYNLPGRDLADGPPAAPDS
jgi:hypothetical protein